MTFFASCIRIMPQAPDAAKAARLLDGSCKLAENSFNLRQGRVQSPGQDGMSHVAITMGVQSLSEPLRFYGDPLGFAEQRWSGGLAFRLGDSLLLLEEDRAATVDPARQALGWRYITLQISDIDTVHN